MSANRHGDKEDKYLNETPEGLVLWPLARLSEGLPLTFDLWDGSFQMCAWLPSTSVPTQLSRGPLSLRAKSVFPVMKCLKNALWLKPTAAARRLSQLTSVCPFSLFTFQYVRLSSS